MEYKNCGKPTIIHKNTLYNCDCMELLKETPDKYYDLAIVDPPYGIDIVNKLANFSAVKHNPKDWDKITPPQEYFEQLKRISKNQIIWGGNYFISKIQNDSSCWIFWDKTNGDSTFADGELAYTSFTSPIRIAKIHWCGSSAIHETGLNKIHPTQKPVALYKWLLKNYAKEGDKILDTHLGSMSIAIACHYMGFELTGCD